MKKKRMNPWAFVQHKQVLKSGWKNNNDPNTPSDAVHTGLGAKATVSAPNQKKETDMKEKIEKDQLKQISGGCNNGHEPQWKPVACNHPGCSEIVKVDVANQSSFKCPKGHINVISKE